MSYGGGAAAARAAAIAQAIKASGAIIRVNPEAFFTILNKSERPLIVIARGGLIRANYQYLTAYKGLIFFTKSPSELMLPGSAEVIFADRIWIPS